jgi:hypothetical protein
LYSKYIKKRMGLSREFGTSSKKVRTAVAQNWRGFEKALDFY